MARMTARDVVAGRIRALEAADTPAIAALMAGHRLWRALDAAAWEGRLRAMLADGHFGYVHVDDRGDLDGFAVLCDRTFGDCGYVRLIGVRSGVTGRGVGKELLRRAEDHFRTLGRRAVVLMCTDWNTAAQRFYVRAGYRVVGGLPDWVAPGTTERLYVRRLSPTTGAAAAEAAQGEKEEGEAMLPSPSSPLRASSQDDGEVWSTERVNPRTADLDRRTTREIVDALHAEDHSAVRAVDAVLDDVARAADVAADVYRRGGRWLFVGAGTSGRLAYAEAAECPPTFGTPPERVLALMAGGAAALAGAVEGAEDDAEAAVRDLEALAITPADLVVGLAASGRTPYVLAAIRHARAVGSRTVAVTAVPDSPLCHEAEIAISPDTGPEAVLGSTRLKAGTAQKLVTNMITTAAMVRLGKVYGNLMVNVQTTNRKLRQRAVRLVALGASVSPERAREALEAAAGDVKVAIAHLVLGVGVAEAARRLADHDDDLRATLGAADGERPR
jgi:N-acetylmuramic acid 6-phosphate etherase